MATDYLRELGARFTLDFDDTALKKVDEKLEGLKSSFISLGLSIGASAGSMFAWAKVTANAGEEALLASQKLGISVESLQQFQYAAGLSNVNADSLTQSLGFLAKNMASAGKKAVPVGQELLNIAAEFQSLPDGAEKTAKAMQLFGRAGKDMIPFLNQGPEKIAELAKEAEDLGAVISKADAELGDKFNDSIDRTTAALKGIGKVIGFELIEKALLPLSEEFRKFLKIAKPQILENIRGVFKGMGAYLKVAFTFMKELYMSTMRFVNLFGGIQKVATTLGIIAGLFISGKILYGIGSVTMAIIKMASAFTLANAAALAIPIAIGLAIAALGLIIEDVVTYFQGGESFFGDFIAKFPVAGKIILEVFSAIKTAIMDVISAFSTVFSMIGKVGSFFSGSLFGSANPTTAPVAGSTTSNGPISNQAQITVNVGNNVDPAAVVPAVQSSVDDGLQRLIRQAQQNFSRGNN